METISPSRLRSYLSCPFRDYLSQQLRMESVDTSKRELATTEFGTLAHHAFQQLFMDPLMKQSVKAAEIEEFLIEAARTEMHRLYGKRPAPLISIQFETLTQNLRYAAETEAAQRQDGWHILLAEEVLVMKKMRLPCLSRVLACAARSTVWIVTSVPVTFVFWIIKRPTKPDHRSKLTPPKSARAKSWLRRIMENFSA